MYLFGFEASEAEHADLISDVLPVVGGALLFQTRHQLLPHLNDAVGHAMDFLQPDSTKQNKKNLLKQQGAMARLPLQFYSYYKSNRYSAATRFKIF